MATTPILDITELASGQVDQYLTTNAAIQALEAAGNDFLSVDLSSGNVTLTAAQYRGYVLFRSSGNTVARDLTLQVIKRLVVIHNDGTATLSVKVGSTTVAVPATEAHLLYSDGTANGLISIAGGAGGGGGTAVSIISPDTSTTHTATDADNGGLLIFDSASDCTLTVPRTSTEALDAGFHLLALNQGGGNLSLALEGSDAVDEVKLWADASQAVTVIKEVSGSPNTWRLMGNGWLPSAVEDDALTAPPATPAVGAVYIPAATATGSWATHEDEFAVHLGLDVYDFVVPADGVEVYEKTSLARISFSGTSWELVNANNENILINGDGIIDQEGISTAIDDGAYAWDQWIVLSDGNGVVTPSQELADVPAGSRSARKLTVAIANKKFGMLQIVEGLNCKQIIDDVASLSMQAKSSGIANLRIAVIGWAGTEDVVTSDVVSAWNAAGTDPTLVANWAYENTPANLAMTTSWADTFKAENISIDTASTKQVAVFIWIDDTDAAVSDTLLVTDTQLEKGTVSTDADRRQVGDEWTRCYRYFVRQGGVANSPVGVGYNPTTTQAAVFTQFPVEMRIAPSLITSGTASDYEVAQRGADKVLTSVPTIAFADTMNARTHWNTTGLTQGDGIMGRPATTDGILGFDARL